jgi:hypothetical protein
MKATAMLGVGWPWTIAVPKQEPCSRGCTAFAVMQFVRSTQAEAPHAGARTSAASRAADDRAPRGGPVNPNDIVEQGLGTMPSRPWLSL